MYISPCMRSCVLTRPVPRALEMVPVVYVVIFVCGHFCVVSGKSIVARPTILHTNAIIVSLTHAPRWPQSLPGQFSPLVSSKCFPCQSMLAAYCCGLLYCFCLELSVQAVHAKSQEGTIGFGGVGPSVHTILQEP